jgi:hypothetical protein
LANEVSLKAVPVDNRASKKQRAATDRKAARVLEANEKDEKLMNKCSKHLPKDLNDILLEPIVGPDEAFELGENFLRRLAEVASAQVDPPKPSPMHFATDRKATATHDQLLCDHDSTSAVCCQTPRMQHQEHQAMVPRSVPSINSQKSWVGNRNSRF